MKKKSHTFTPPSASLQLDSGATITTVAPTLDNLLREGKLKRADLGRYFTALKIFHEQLGYIPAEYTSANTVPVPVEALILASKVLDSAAFAKHNAKIAEEARQREERLLGQAAEIRNQRREQGKRPSDRAVAMEIDPDNWDAIRKLIREK